MTVADFIAAFPAFADEDAAVIQRYLDASTPWFDLTNWDGFLNDGIGNWIAHRIVMEDYQRVQARLKKDNQSEPGMPQSSRSVDQVVQVRYSEALLTMSAKDPYMRTTYGQQFRYLSGIAGGGAVST